MPTIDNKAKALNDIANDLEPPEEKIQKPSKEEHEYSPCIVLSAIAPSKEQSEEATRHAETIINMGLTVAETETCKKRAMGRIQKW